jgi:hypothetical protein
MIKKLVGLLALAVTLSAAAPALAKETRAKPPSYATVARDIAAPARTCVIDHVPGNYEDTTPHPFAESCH